MTGSPDGLAVFVCDGKGFSYTTLSLNSIVIMNDTDDGWLPDDVTKAKSSFIRNHFRVCFLQFFFSFCTNSPQVSLEIHLEAGKYIVFACHKATG